MLPEQCKRQSNVLISQHDLYNILQSVKTRLGVGGGLNLKKTDLRYRFMGGGGGGGGVLQGESHQY